MHLNWIWIKKIKLNSNTLNEIQIKFNWVSIQFNWIQISKLKWIKLNTFVFSLD
jgi:hypothetical protein